MRVGTTSSQPGRQPADRPALSSTNLSGDPTLEAVARGEKTLSRGASGEAVKTLQKALVIVGRGIGADGSFGPKTEAGLKGFQKEAGLPQTGKLDAATVTALDRRLEVPDNPYVDDSSYDGSLLDAMTEPVRPAPARTTFIAARPPAAGTRARLL